MQADGGRAGRATGKARTLQGECHLSSAAPSGAVSLPMKHQLGKTQEPETKRMTFEFHGLVQSGAEILQSPPPARPCEVKPGLCVCTFER